MRKKGKKITLMEVGATLSAITITLKDLGESMAFVVERMATKDDIKNMATKDDIAAVRQEMATKEDVRQLRERVENLEKGQEEILKELKPLSRAHDQDSETIIDHGKRIVRLEKELSLQSL